MTLSILICSLYSRAGSLSVLLAELEKQINGNPLIEVLVNIDNKELTTGAKRQLLLEQATGEYIIFIDDDDWVEPCYIEELLQAAASGKDCFGMFGWITENGGNRIDWELSKNFYNRTVWRNGKLFYERTTNHITGVKRKIALKAGFPDKSNAEDQWYSNRVAPLCQTEYSIKPFMYHYRFSTFNKEYQ